MEKLYGELKMCIIIYKYLKIGQLFYLNEARSQ